MSMRDEFIVGMLVAHMGAIAHTAGMIGDRQRAAAAFCELFNLHVRQTADWDLLLRATHAFAALPYENLSKLIAKHNTEPQRFQEFSALQLVEGFDRAGTGGTCFALVALFSAVLSHLGFANYPVLCDARQTVDNHCALVVIYRNRSYVIDPGYLLFEPLELPMADTLGEENLVSQRLAVDSGVACLLRGAHPHHYDLITYGTRRYLLKNSPVAPERFWAAWQASFDWTMMNDVHLCVPHTGGYVYVRGHKLRIRENGQTRAENIRGREDVVLSERFGIDAQVVRRAYRLVAADRQARDRNREESPS